MYMKDESILVACSSLDYILILKTLQGRYILNRVERREDIIKFSKEFHYDLLLIDIAFLKPDFEVIREVVKMKIPVVALSSEPSDAQGMEMKRNGCCACYVKPIRKESLIECIDHWIRWNSNIK